MSHSIKIHTSKGGKDMAELFEYKCPSCGALLKISPEESFVKCSYCGTIVERELDDDEKASASAKKLAGKVEKYKKDMHELDTLKDSMLSKDQKIRSLESSSKVESGFMRENPGVVPVIIIICGIISLFGSGEDKFAGLIGCLLAAAVVYGFTVSGKDNAEKAASESISKMNAEKKELEEMQDKYNKLKKSFDPEFIPSQYRNDQALDYIIGLFRTEQASAMGEAFKRYDDHMHQKKMESLQQEQVDLQRQQLKKMDEMQSGSSLGSAAVKTGAAAVGGVLIAGKVIKDILDDL